MNILILAAGKGTRMKSALPKVLHPVGGQSMLGRVVGTALQFENPHVVVVVGHGAQAVQHHLSSQPGIRFATQSEQLGTGHAVQCASSALADHPVTLILYGDVPLIQFESLQPLVQAALAGQMGLMTLNMSNPHGYGRILRDTEGAVVGIV
jgi:bifunctional UDP-N-acetylglucosamine pyrophosphorylase/glucosamine-1-phosphate N-acetyltransferase